MRLVQGLVPVLVRSCFSPHESVSSSHRHLVSCQAEDEVFSAYFVRLGCLMSRGFRLALSLFFQARVLMCFGRLGSTRNLTTASFFLIF